MDNDTFNGTAGDSWSRDDLTPEQAKENIVDYLWEQERDDFINYIKTGGDATDHIFWDCLVATFQNPHDWLNEYINLSNSE